MFPTRLPGSVALIMELTCRVGCFCHMALLSQERHEELPDSCSYITRLSCVQQEAKTPSFCCIFRTLLRVHRMVKYAKTIEKTSKWEVLVGNKEPLTLPSHPRCQPWSPVRSSLAAPPCSSESFSRHAGACVPGPCCALPT